MSWAGSPRLKLIRWKALRPVMIWFLEDYRDDVVLVVRVQHFGLSDPSV